MPSITILYIFLAALFATLVLIPPVSRLAVHMGMLDRPDERKRHAQETPRLGGVAIFFALLLALLLFGKFSASQRGFLAGAVIVFLTGLADDLTGLTPGRKLAGEALASFFAVVVGGFQLTGLGDLFGFGDVNLGYLGIPFTMFAIVGITNAINLLDGLDGLAAGLSAIAAGAFGLLAYLSGNGDLLVLTAALLGTLIGFLRYNTFPATIFMGDGGSLLLGYCLGVFSVFVVEGGTGYVSEITPLIILTVPILDTLIVVRKRLRSGRSPFSPDRSHIHHRLMGFGFGHKSVVIIVYVFSYLFAAFAVASFRLPDRQLGAAALLLSLAFYLGNRFLDLERRKGNRPFLRSNQPIRQTATYRRMVEYSRYLRVVVKYLMLAILFLTMLTPPVHNGNSAVIAAFLLLLSILLLVSREGGNRFLLFVLYFNGAFFVYQFENYGRALSLAGVPLLWVSHVVFLLLFVLGGVKIFLRRRTAKLASSPLEYLILCLVISVPLFPDDFVGRYHLLTVTGKSIILFMVYKLILMHEARRNRKVILATLAALCVLVVKNFM